MADINQVLLLDTLKDNPHFKAWRQKLVYDSFMTGVDWTLKAIIKTGDVFDMSEKEAELFREHARKVIAASTEKQASK